MIMKSTPLLSRLSIASLFLATSCMAADVTTYHNNSSHTGVNPDEITLTPGNVNVNSFGLKFNVIIAGKLYAQPLYVSSVPISTSGSFIRHNLVIVATELDNVYAFDADNLTSSPLWHASFIDPLNGITTVPKEDVEGVGSDITPEIGISATPVIDLNRNAIYVLARTKEVVGSQSGYVQRLHALDLTTGLELPGSPEIISAQVNGTGAGSDGHGHINFDGKRQNPRPALLLLDGVVYACWASLGDLGPFHGWMIGYDGGSFEQVAVFNTTPNGIDGGIWQGGGGPASDADGNIFVIVGNGTFDAASGGSDYGDSVLKLTNNGSSLFASDSFTPYNQAIFDNADYDLGSGGPLLLPDQPGLFPHLAVFGGKDATLYVLNRDNLGQFSKTANNIPMFVPGVVGKPPPGTSGNRTTPAYWNGNVYFTGSGDFLKSFSLFNGLLSPTALASGPDKYNYPGAVAAISANGNTNGIVWVLQADRFKTGAPLSVNVIAATLLSAFNASKFAETFAAVSLTSMA